MHEALAAPLPRAKAVYVARDGYHHLGPGARVALSPGRTFEDAAELTAAMAHALRPRWEPVAGCTRSPRAGYLAGTEAERLGDSTRAARPHDRGVWCLRGGYTGDRLAERDYDALRGGRELLGYSDITALHAAIGLRTSS